MRTISLLLILLFFSCSKEYPEPVENNLDDPSFCIVDSVYSSPYDENFQVVVKPITAGVIVEIRTTGNIRKVYCYPDEPK